MRIALAVTPKQIAQLRLHMQAVQVTVDTLIAGSDLERAQFVGVIAGQVVVEVPDAPEIES